MFKGVRSSDASPWAPMAASLPILPGCDDKFERPGRTVGRGRAPFDAAMAEVVAATKPPVVSFQLGLPNAALLARVKATGARI